MSGFVVCQSCGTRIKAGRRHCLRCFEPLPDPDEPVRPTLWVSLGLSRNAEIAIGIGTALAVALLGAVIWQTWPAPVDDLAQPSGPAGFAAAAPPSVPQEVRDPSGRAVVQPVPAEVAGGPNSASADPALEAARAGYEEKLSGQPNNPVLVNDLGQTLERMGRTDEAVARYERAVSLAPLEPTYRLNLARVASALGQWDRAVNQYREAVRLRPTDYDALNALGLTLQKKGDDQSAVPEFQRARRINPSAPEAALGLANSLEKVGRIDEAVQQFRQYLDLRPAPADADQVKAHLATLSRARPQVK